MKIGIMGGTFDPVHLGHLIAAEQARVEIGLDEVWFMPAAVPPHKTNAPKATVSQRWEMTGRAIHHHEKFRVNDLEIRRGGTSYTIDTVKELRRLHPDIDFYYIIGADMVQYLPKWHQIELLAANVTFIGLRRPGFAIRLDLLARYIGERVILVSMPLIDISSTDIRELRKNRRSIRFLVPETVYAYIEEHGLYEA